MNTVSVTGLRVTACHGVLPEEKVTPQPFLFDFSLAGDLSVAAESDCLRDTFDYAQACNLVREIALSRPYNLIEKLAAECAFALAERFAAARRVSVTVHKPCAPVGAEIADVTAEYSLAREKVYLSLGSSMGDREQSLRFALGALGAVRGIKITQTSPFILSEPYGGVAKNAFLNCVAEADCLLTPQQLLKKIHEIEAAGGRVRDRRWDDRTLDIDIVFFGSRVLAEEGLIVPHPDYFNRPFVLGPLKTIAPDFVCPVKRRAVRDIVCGGQD